ncbi:thiamine-phosphate kinase [Geofilum rubicundum]|uniref:Thiamine-monophosphate kinase n=1 Tax=Geofilum rubicundum JCM 15548 TaxID=1236989 RepID=A0A0E9LT06_9BACT|nr:thiamine-phosphate kinase [Geofilum rubicundum]GAO28727.1 thiamine-monophosphate kinase [Geofilum rubicundum JCM 15548]
MKLSEIGEFGFIERFAHRFEDLLAPNAMGIGDDCAIIPAGDDHDLVLTTDMLVEDIHFIRDKISPLDLGHKALAVNLSDVAAMGARPVGSFLSIAIPHGIDVEYLDQLMEGYHQLSERYQLPLMGGDTTRSPHKLVLNISVVGRVAKGTAKLRSAAQEGDVVAVTGMLGDSAAGLHALINNLSANPESSYLIEKHVRPHPHIEQGLWLGRQRSVHAMMDVSDGIASDMKHILKASGLGAGIELSQLPLSDQLKAFSAQHQLNAFELATSGGEDYCLLLTVEADSFQETAASYKEALGADLYAIGFITSDQQLKWTKDHQSIAGGLKDGFNHFL